MTGNLNGGGQQLGVFQSLVGSVGIAGRCSVSNSNVLYLPTWFKREQPLPESPRYCFPTTRETLELLAAFSRIESPVYRRMIIGTAPEAVLASSPSDPPKNAAVRSFSKNRPADAVNTPPSRPSLVASSLFRFALHCRVAGFLILSQWSTPVAACSWSRDRMIPSTRVEHGPQALHKFLRPN
jgi:hypothetical protein